MNNLAGDKLREIIVTHGRSVCDDRLRCRGLLHDLCGQHRREIFVLLSALEDGVVAELLNSKTGVPLELLLARLTKRLQDNLALAEDACRWAVESWALALDVLAAPLPVPQKPPRQRPTRPSQPPTYPTPAPTNVHQTPSPTFPWSRRASAGAGVLALVVVVVAAVLLNHFASPGTAPSTRTKVDTPDTRPNPNAGNTDARQPANGVMIDTAGTRPNANDGSTNIRQPTGFVTIAPNGDGGPAEVLIDGNTIANPLRRPIPLAVGKHRVQTRGSNDYAETAQDIEVNDKETVQVRPLLKYGFCTIRVVDRKTKNEVNNRNQRWLLERFPHRPVHANIAIKVGNRLLKDQDWDSAAALKLLTGPQLLEVRGKFYHPHSRTLNIVSGKTESVVVELVPKDSGTITIKLTNHPYATVTAQLDDEVPIQSSALAATYAVTAGEKHTLIVTGTDYEKTTRSFTVGTGEDHVLEVPLTPKSTSPLPRRMEGKTYLTNSLGMHFVRLPSSEDKKIAALNVGVYEVTQAQYAKVMGENPAGFKGEYQPVEMVPFARAEEFCQKLSARPDEKEAGRSYRLLTETEWEYACRAGSTTTYHWGNEFVKNKANFTDEGVGKTTVVGSYPPNAFGLYDMHGNVGEWCESAGTEGAVVRGGSWFEYAKDWTVTGRGQFENPFGSNYIGFRVVLIQKK